MYLSQCLSATRTFISKNRERKQIYRQIQKKNRILNKTTGNIRQIEIIIDKDNFMATFWTIQTLEKWKQVQKIGYLVGEANAKTTS